MLDSLPDSELHKTNHDIILGDDKPKLIITEIMSPFCGPCGSSMRKATDLLYLFREGLQIRMLLTDNKGDKEKNKVIISHLLALSKELNQEQMVKVLSDWFEKMDYTDWSTKHPLKEISLTEREITEYLEKVKLYRTTYTPALFIGKKPMRPTMSIHDLRYYLDDTLCQTILIVQEKIRKMKIILYICSEF